jgi:hypothetical protein
MRTWSSDARSLDDETINCSGEERTHEKWTKEREWGSKCEVIRETEAARLKQYDEGMRGGKDKN